MPQWSIWLRRVVVAALLLIFVASGVAKLAGAPQMLEVFARFQLPHWFMRATGVIECAGALGLLVPMRLARAASAAMLCVTMLAGAGFHMVHDPPVAAAPALVLAFTCGWLALGAWRQDGRRLA